jgi:hypothetical protein
MQAPFDLRVRQSREGVVSGPSLKRMHANPEVSDQQHGVLMMTYGIHVSSASSQGGLRPIDRPQKAMNRWSRWRLHARPTSAKPALGLAIAAAVIPTLGAPATARSPYDRLWSVVIMAEPARVIAPIAIRSRS